MTNVTQPLRDEHGELLPHIEALRIAADAVGEADAGTLRAAVDAAWDFLSHHLIPHAEAEEAALYPVVARVMGAPEATKTMSRDHVEVRRLVDELATLRDAVHGGVPASGQDRDLRAVLYGLYALVKLHFAKEEEVYLPILDSRLSPADAHAMFEAMEAAAGAAHAGARH
jgi:hemerythrin-like domain-containing protein